MNTRPHRDSQPDEGQISLMMLGFTTVLLSVLLVVTGASAVHLAHKRLAQLTDAAAADAADALDKPVYYDTAQPDLRSVPISDQTVAAAAARVLALQQVNGCASLSIVTATRLHDPERARVTLRCTVSPPFVGEMLGRTVTVPITATAQAQAPIRE